MSSEFHDQWKGWFAPLQPPNRGYLTAREPPRWEIQRRKWPQAPKVVHVVLSLDVGGLERLVVDLVREGLRLGQKAVVICIERHGKLAPQVEAMGVEVHCLYKQPGIRPGLVGQLVKLFRKIQPDVVHTHQVGALSYAGAAARRWMKAEGRRRKAEGEASGVRHQASRAEKKAASAEGAILDSPGSSPGEASAEGAILDSPGSGPGEENDGLGRPSSVPEARGWPVVIHTEHGKHYAQRRRTRWLGKWAGRYADKFCCVSKDVADEVRRLRVVPESKIIVVGNGIDIATFARSSAGSRN